MFSFDRRKLLVSALGTGIYLEKYKIRYVWFQIYLRFQKERKNDFDHRKVYVLFDCNTFVSLGICFPSTFIRFPFPFIRFPKGKSN